MLLAESSKALFEQVWREHHEHLLKVCLRKLGDAADAEDALASISITVMEKLPQAHGRILNLRAWLVQVATNHCVDVQRRRQRQLRVFESASMEDGEEHWPAADGLSSEQLLLEQELWELAHSLIKALPPLLQQVADQHILQQLPYPQIADNLGLSQANVRKRVQKARELLWQQLYSYLEE